MHVESQPCNVVRNATWLFSGVTSEFRNAETWWSAMLSMFLLLNGRSGEKLELNERRYRKDGTQEIIKLTLPGNLQYEDIVCDGRLTKESARAFGLESWPKGLSQQRPDITVFLDGRKGRKVLFLEVKTIRAEKDGRKQMKNYLELCQLLRDSGSWDEARVVYVLSEGHEGSQEGSEIWNHLMDNDISFIYWEDLLSEIQESPLASIFRGITLASYTALPPI